MPFEAKREQTLERLAQAYSHDYLTLDEYEQRVQELNDTRSFDRLDELVGDLPATILPATTLSAPLSARGVPVSAPEQVLEGSAQILRRRGLWLRSQRVVVRQSGAMVRLDLDDLRELRSLQVELTLDVTSSMIRIAVPLGTRVIDETRSHNSMVTIRRRLSRRESTNGPVLLLSGEVNGSMVRVTRLRHRG